MATKKTEDVKTDRRGFLKFAGLGSLAGGAALVSSKAADAAGVEADPRGEGYSETDHVKTFYATARF